MFFFNKIRLSIHQITCLIKDLIFLFIKNKEDNKITILDKCFQDIFFWLEFFAAIPNFDPQDKTFNTILSFTEFINTTLRKTFIEKLTHAIDTNSSLIVQKSKGLGATTSIILTAFYYMLYKSNSRIVIVLPAFSGNKFPYNATSLFYFIIQLFKKLPSELCTCKNIQYKHHVDVIRYYTLTNPVIRSTIILLAPNKPLDLSSFFPDLETLTYRAVIFDEFAFQKHATSMWLSIKNLPLTKIIVSSANGTSNLFYDLVSKRALPVFTMHWLNNPECDQKWYDNICKHHHPFWVEQYINIDYNFKYFPKRAAKKSPAPSQHKTPAPAKNRKPRSKSSNTYKPHKNPADISSACAYDSALTKYILCTTPSLKNNTANIRQETLSSLQNYKQNLNNSETRILSSLQSALSIINFSNLIKIDSLQFNTLPGKIFSIFKLINSPADKKTLSLFIKRAKSKISA